MSCRAPGAELCFDEVGTSTEEPLLTSRTQPDGLRRSDVSVPDIHRGGCLQKIATARCAPGSMTPITGTVEAALICSMARAVAVLHAITSSSAPRCSRNCALAEAYLATVRTDLAP